MAVYIEEVAALNGLVDYCLLALTARLGGLPLRRSRCAAAAVLGGAYAAAMALTGMAAWLPLRLAACAVLTVVAFGRAELLRRTALFCAVSFGFAGTVLLMSGLTGRTLYQDGVYCLEVSLRALVLAAAVGWLAGGVLLRGEAAHGLLRRDTVRLRLRFCGRETEVVALRDTGNALVDPATGLPVLVLDPSAAVRLLPPELGWLPGALTAENAPALLARIPGGLRTRFRLVPYRSLGRENGLLLAFRPDEGRLLAALSPTRLTTGACEALYGA